MFNFLSGLKLEYNQAGAQVLGKDHFPIIGQAHAFFANEESRRDLMLNTVSRGKMHWQLFQTIEEEKKKGLRILERIKRNYC